MSNERQKRHRGVDFYEIDIKKEKKYKREKRHVLKKIMRRSFALRSIPSTTFFSFSSLKGLEIKNDRVPWRSDVVMTVMTVLTVLTVRSFAIRSIPSTTFSSLKGLEIKTDRVPWRSDVVLTVLTVLAVRSFAIRSFAIRSIPVS